MTTLAEFDLAGYKFTVDRIPPAEQFHLMRKMAPVNGALVDLVKKMQTEWGPTPIEELSDAAKLERAASYMNANMQAFNAISEEDMNFIMATCLSRVRMQNERGTWAAVWAGGRVMFDSLDYSVILELILKVVQENLQSFTPGPLAQSGTTTSQAA